MTSPARSQVRFELVDADVRAARHIFHAMLGRVVPITSDARVDISAWATGIYWVVAELGEGRHVSTRFVKQ